MFHPIKLAEETRKIVEKDGQRKYYRFRAAKFYGGIATADCVGCNLRCKFCWAWNVVNNPDKIGKYYRPEEVAEKLATIAEKKGFRKLRISGNEPTLCKDHLLSVLGNISEHFLFILETNGILIGHDNSYAKDLSKFRNLHVRVAFKGSNPEEFSKLTGAVPEAYELQLKALEHLEKTGCSYNPALMSFSEDKTYLLENLETIKTGLSREVEYESLIRYPAVVKRMKEII